VGRTRRGVSDALSWIGTIPGRISGVFSRAGSWLYGKGQQIISGMWSGIKNIWSSVSSWFTGLPAKILHALGIHSPPAWAIQAGKDIMSGLHIGLGHGLGPLTGFTAGIGQKLAAAAAGALSGTGGNTPAWIQAALSIAGGPASWLGPLETLVSRESGGNPLARNKQTAGISGEHAEGLFQTIPSTFAAYALPGHGDIWNPIDDAIAGIRYIRAVWGSPFNIPGLLGGGGYSGYAGGTSSAAPGWAWVGESGPELMRFRGGEQVVPAGRSGSGNSYHITVSVPPGANLAEAGRVTVAAIQQYEKRSGKGWRS
jgi:SLT domain-containing protein